MHLVPPARQHRQAMARRRLVLSLGQNATTDSDHCIGSQNGAFRVPRRHHLRLFGGQAGGMVARQLATKGGLVNVRRINDIRRDAHLFQQVETARRSRRKNQARTRRVAGHADSLRPGADRPNYLKRKVMRPLVRS